MDGAPAAGAMTAEVGEMLQGLRSQPALGERPTIRESRPRPPGPWRATTPSWWAAAPVARPAGIGAARGGARTLVLEYLHGLGGVGTLGRITNYYHGNRVGFTAEIDAGVAAYEPAASSAKGWNIEHKMEWLRSEIVKAGGEVWFHTPRRRIPDARRPVHWRGGRHPARPRRDPRQHRHRRHRQRRDPGLRRAWKPRPSPGSTSPCRAPDCPP